MLGSDRLCLIIICGLILAQKCLGGKNSKNKADMKGGASKSNSDMGQSSRNPAPQSKRLVDLTELLDDHQFQGQATGSAASTTPSSIKTSEQHRNVMLAKIFRDRNFLWFGENIGSPSFFSLTPKSDLLFRVAIGISNAKLTRIDLFLAGDEVSHLSEKLKNSFISCSDPKCETAIRSAISPHLRALFEVENIFYQIGLVGKFIPEYRKQLEVFGVKTIGEDDKPPSKSTDRPRITDLMFALENSPQTVTEDSIKSAIDEYKQLNQLKKDGLEVDPRLRLVVDFAMLPAIKYSIVPDVETLIRAYAKFRPGYVEKQPIGEGKLPENSDGFLELMKQALGMLSGEPSKAGFVRAKLEYTDAANKLIQYRKESNIYDNLEELAKVINLLNHQHSEIFLLQVYPEINHKMKPRETFKHFRQYLSGERSLMFHPDLMNMGRLFLELEKAHLSNSDGSAITPDMLKAAETEYKAGTDQKYKGYFDNSIRSFLEDSVLWPMTYISKNNIATNHKKFFNDLVERYGLLRKSYFGDEQFGDGKFPSHIEDMQKLFGMVSGQIRKKPTLDEFQAAMKEFGEIAYGLKSKFESGEWDVREHQDQLYQFNNFGRYPPMVVFVKYIVSEIPRSSNPKKLLEKFKAFLDRIGFSLAEPSEESNLIRTAR